MSAPKSFGSDSALETHEMIAMNKSRPAILMMLVLYVCSSHAADTILYNDRIVTVDADFTIAEAVAISDGRILQVGENNEIRELAQETTKLVDMGGKTILPGFIDTHPHMIHVGSGHATVSLFGVSSIEEIKRRIAERVKTNQEGQWIFASSIGDPRGVRALPGLLEEKRWPTRYDLDEVSPDIPVYIPTSWGGPTPAILNSKALELMGINTETPVFDKGIEIIKDAATGEPNGQIIGMHAYNWNPYYGKISGFAPKYPIALLADGVEGQIRKLNSLGVTSVYESHFLTETNIVTIQYLLDHDRLKMRMKLAPELFGAQWKPINAIDDWIRVLKRKESDPSSEPHKGDGSNDVEITTIANGEMVKMLGTTLSSDGPISFGEAMMNEPYWNMYGDPASTDLPLSVETIMKVAMIAAKYDLRMTFPVGGDQMADTVLEALEAVDKEYPLEGRNWVLGHTPYMTRERLQRIRNLGLKVTANSNSEYKFTKELYESTFRDLAEERAYINTPWRWILDSGITSAQSTDNVFADPMFTLWQSLKRATEAPGETLMTDSKRISREEAVRLHTMGGARVLMWEDELGSVEAGKFADLVVLDTDILNCPLDDIRSTKVLATLIGGQVVHGELD